MLCAFSIVAQTFEVGSETVRTGSRLMRKKKSAVPVTLTNEGYSLCARHEYRKANSGTGKHVRRLPCLTKVLLELHF